MVVGLLLWLLAAFIARDMFTSSRLHAFASSRLLEYRVDEPSQHDLDRAFAQLRIERGWPALDAMRWRMKGGWDRGNPKAQSRIVLP